MVDRISAACLKSLGYSPKWMEYGCLTPELLLAQAAQFRTGGDSNTEHYRYAAFKQLQRRDHFSDREFEQYLELAAVDPDPGMARAALIDLIYHPGLTEKQGEAVLAHPYLQQLPRLIKKVRLLKELRAPTVPEAVLWRCLQEGDGDVQLDEAIR